MGHFLVERYLPSSEGLAIAGDAERLARSAGAHLLLTIYSPEDETCFHLFDAGSSSGVQDAVLRAGMEIDRIVPVVPIDGTEED